MSKTENEEYILIVDDEPEILNVLGDFAKRWGLNVKTATSYEDALGFYRKGAATAILSDISMPGKSGIDLLKTVRASGSDVPIALISAYDTKEHLLKAIQYGAACFVEKPFVLDELKDTLYVLMDLGRRIQRQEFNEKKERKMIHLLRIHLRKSRKAA